MKYNDREMYNERLLFTGASSCFIEQTVNSDGTLLMNHI